MEKFNQVTWAAHSFEPSEVELSQAPTINCAQSLGMVLYAVDRGPVWSWMKKHVPAGFDKYLKNPEGYFIRLRRDDQGVVMLEISAWKPGTFKESEQAKNNAFYDDSRNGIIRLTWNPGEGDGIVSGIILNQGAYMLKKERAASEFPDDFEVLERIMTHPDHVDPDERHQLDGAIRWLCLEVISTIRQRKSLALLGARFDRKQEARDRIKKEIIDSLDAGPGIWDPAVKTNWTEPEKYVVTQLCRMMREGVRDAGDSKLDLPTRKDLAEQMKKDFTAAKRKSLWEIKTEPAEIVYAALKALGLDWLK